VIPPVACHHPGGWDAALSGRFPKNKAVYWHAKSHSWLIRSKHSGYRPQNPLGRSVSLLSRKKHYNVGGGSFGPGNRRNRRCGWVMEAWGMQVECLHRSIQHSQDTPTIWFGECFFGIYLARRQGSTSLVAAGSVWPQSSGGVWWVSHPHPRFSYHGSPSLRLTAELYTAIRVGRRALQGSHLVPPALLCRLHDTRLAHSSSACFQSVWLSVGQAAPEPRDSVICFPP